MKSTPTTNKSQSVLVSTLIIYAINFAICYLLKMVFAKITMQPIIHMVVTNLCYVITLAAVGIIYCKTIAKKKCDCLTIVLLSLLLKAIVFVVCQFVLVKILTIKPLLVAASNILGILPIVCIAMVVTLPKSEYLKKLQKILLILTVVCLVLSVITFAIGEAGATEKGEAVGECYKCDGLGKVKQNGIIVTCPVCNGFGGNVISTDVRNGPNELIVPTLVVLCVGVMSFVWYLQLVKIVKKENP